MAKKKQKHLVTRVTAYHVKKKTKQTGSTTRIRSGGGAATAAGVRFQENVATWFAVQILAERAISPGFGLSDHVTLDSIMAESFSPVDDLQVGTSNGGQLFLQCKTKLSLSPLADSELASVIKQFVKQLIAGHKPAGATARELSVADDRLILAVGKNTANTITRDLAGAIEAIGTATNVQLLQEFESSRNQEQKDAIAILRPHFDREWLALMGSQAADEDWLRFVQLTRVHKFDLSADGEHRRHADLLLRNQILRDPTNAGAAWSTLVHLVRSFAPSRIGGDQSFFRQQLATDYQLHGPRSYHDDIQAVSQYSRVRLALLEEHSKVACGDRTLKLARPAVDAIADMAIQGDLIVLGDPGAGKSGCMHAFASRVFEDGLGCVLLEAEHLDATSIATISRDLGITQGHSLVDVLANWPTNPTEGQIAAKYLVIDALDAARAQVNLNTLCDLVRQIRLQAPDWHVVVSIREFDLKHSHAVQELFPGGPHELFKSDSFTTTRHLRVPQLTDEELQSAKHEFPKLTLVLNDGGPALLALARNPFNLRLLVELIAKNTPTSSLAAVRVQVDLLDRYWETRIEADAAGSFSHTVRQLIEEMKRQRELSVDRSKIVASLGGKSEELQNLLKLGLLRSEQRSKLSGAPVFLSFSHNILFDYAAAREWLQDLSPHVIAELQHKDNQDLVLFARPSIVMAFQRLWYLDGDTDSHQTFWDRAIAIAYSDLRLIGRIIAAGVVASEFRQRTDITYLLDQVAPKSDSKQGTLLQHVVTAVRTRFDGSASMGNLISPIAPPWLAVAVAMTERGLFQNAWHIRQLLLPIELDKKIQLTDNQRMWANNAARTLLTWPRTISGASAVEVTAIAVACRTILANSVATVQSLEPLLDTLRSEDWHELLTPISQHFRLIASVNPRFAGKVLKAVYSKEYDRDDRLISGGRLLSLSFSKHDSLDIARRTIGKEIASLGKRRPRATTYLTVKLMRLIVAAKNRKNGSRPRQLYHVSFRGAKATIVPDNSYIWADSSHRRYDAWFPALADLQKMLERLGTEPEASSQLDGVLDIVARHARPAIVWNALLRSAAKAPATLGVKVAELLLSSDVLTGYDTKVAAGQLITAVWAHLSSERRLQIENAVLSLTGNTDADHVEYRVRDRDALLGCIPTDAAESAEVKTILAQLDKQGGPPQHVPLITVGQAHWLTDEECLSDCGVDLNASGNQAMRDLTQKVEAVTPSAGKQLLSLEQAETLFSIFLKLQTSLADADEHDVHEVIRSRAEVAAYETLAKLAKTDGLTSAHSIYKQLRQQLIEASHDPRPERQKPEEECTSDQSVGWASGQPRIVAANGLVELASNLPKIDGEIAKTLRRLASDPHWAVRFQVRAQVNALWDSDRELMWKIIEEASQQESNLRVLRFFVNTLVDSLRAIDPERIDSIVTRVQNRVDDIDKHESIADKLAELVTWRVVVHNHQPSHERIAQWIADPLRSQPYAKPVIRQCCGLMVLDTVGKDTEEGARARKWAFGVLQIVIERVLELHKALIEANNNQPFDRWTKEDLDRLKAIYQLADDVSNQVFYASGAFNEKHNSTNNKEDSAQNPKEIERFFREGHDLLERLCDCPFVHSAHDLLQVLEFMVPQDPAAVFRLIHRCLFASRKDFIHHESLVVDLVVTIVERYLAEHRTLFRQDQELRMALLDVLDLFVEVGWPQATRLTFRLDEVFR